jgi:hypothetical protein
MPDPLALDSESLDPGLLVQAAGSIRPVVLSETAWKRVSISRDITGTMGSELWGQALHFAAVNCKA